MSKCMPSSGPALFIQNISLSNNLLHWLAQLFMFAPHTQCIRIGVMEDNNVFGRILHFGQHPKFHPKDEATLHIHLFPHLPSSSCSVLKNFMAASLPPFITTWIIKNIKKTTWIAIFNHKHINQLHCVFAHLHFCWSWFADLEKRTLLWIHTTTLVLETHLLWRHERDELASVIRWMVYSAVYFSLQLLLWHPPSFLPEFDSDSFTSAATSKMMQKLTSPALQVLPPQGRRECLWSPTKMKLVREKKILWIKKPCGRWQTPSWLRISRLRSHSQMLCRRHQALEI